MGGAEVAAAGNGCAGDGNRVVAAEPAAPGRRRARTPRPPPLRSLISQRRIVMRATRIVPAGQRPAGSPIRDTVILDFEQRRARHGVFVGVNGTSVELDLAEPARLRTDDTLVLEDGSLVEVVAKPEPL